MFGFIKIWGWWCVCIDRVMPPLFCHAVGQTPWVTSSPIWVKTGPTRVSLGCTTKSASECCFTACKATIYMAKMYDIISHVLWVGKTFKYQETFFFIAWEGTQHQNTVLHSYCLCAIGWVNAVVSCVCPSVTGMDINSCTAQRGPSAWPTWPAATCTGSTRGAPCCPLARCCSVPAAFFLPCTGQIYTTFTTMLLWRTQNSYGPQSNWKYVNSIE